jgi:hypothetical protein
MTSVLPPTEEQLQNLETLAAYLSKNDLKANFDMGVYCGPEVSNQAEECGSAGCAIGHGPYVGIQKFTSETWGEYSVRVFGLGYYDKNWKHCFDPEWALIDNTPESAAKRITEVIARFRNGLS